MKSSATGWVLRLLVAKLSIRLGYVALTLAAFYACSSPSTSENGGVQKLYDTEIFKSYWHDGKAEISSYKLDQSRYGEVREGRAMLIFVTEDFSRRKQVKLDDPSTAGDDKVSVIKLNFTKNFVTGIYPYSMMLSVFSPINSQHSLKVTMSSQEWCGQVFSQMNLDGNQYSFTGHSYFENEGEERFSVRATWLEDELWNAIRLDPNSLPIGEIEIIPGLFFTRLAHEPQQAMQAIITKNEWGEEVSYTLDMPVQERQLVVRYQKKFPHKIMGWQESFVERGQKQQTTAILDKTIRIDYWTKNKNEFKYWRDSLGLSPTNF